MKEHEAGLKGTRTWFFWALVVGVVHVVLRLGDPLPIIIGHYRRERRPLGIHSVRGEARVAKVQHETRNNCAGESTAIIRERAAEAKSEENLHVRKCRRATSHVWLQDNQACPWANVEGLPIRAVKCVGEWRPTVDTLEKHLLWKLICWPRLTPPWLYQNIINNLLTRSINLSSLTQNK